MTWKPTPAEEKWLAAAAPLDALMYRLERDQPGWQASCTHSLGDTRCAYCGAPALGPPRPS